MNDPMAHKSLRLVGGSVAQSPRALPRDHAARSGIGAVRALAARHASGGAAPTLAQRRAVEAENKAAAMSALDPRWALAVRTSSMLQGGRAAILPPESRRFLVQLGKDINLRPFDSNLVIAIVQDAARAGYDPIGTESRMRLKMVREPVPTQDHPSLRWIIGAIGLGAVGLWFMIRVFGAG